METTGMTATDILLDNGYEDVVVFENPSYDEALIGVSDDNRAVYDYDLMVESLQKEDNISEEDAREFIDYNTLQAYPPKPYSKPVVVFKLYK